MRPVDTLRFCVTGLAGLVVLEAHQASIVVSMLLQRRDDCGDADQVELIDPEGGKQRFLRANQPPPRGFLPKVDDGWLRPFRKEKRRCMIL